MSLVVDFTVTIDGTDVSAFVLAGGTIDYGRQGRGVQFSAPIARFDMLLPEANPLPSPGTFPTLEKRQEVLIHVTRDGSTQIRRFTGSIQALDYNRTQVSVTAAGCTVEFDKTTTQDTDAFAPRSVEIDSDRVEWLADGSPTAVTIESTGARRIRQIDRNTPGQPLLDAILRVADDADGLFMEDRLGVPRYRSRNFTLPSRYTLPHEVIDSEDLVLSTDAGDSISTVRVFYGEPKQSTGVQNYKIAIDSAMAVALGFDASVDIYTDLATADAAQDKANQYLAQHSDLFSLPDVPLLLRAASTADFDDIMDLQEGWPVTIETLPDGWPVESIDADIVGFTDIMHQTDYRVILHLGPPRDFEGVDDTDPIYPDGSITGYDATGTEDRDDKTYRWCRWDASGFATNHYTTDPMFVRLAAAAKGGDGGDFIGIFGHGGNGGAGGFIDEHIDLNPGTWPVTVGVAANAGDTVFFGTHLYRGGDGGNALGDPDGQDGGSGGGPWYNRADNTLHGDNGVGVVGQGHDADATHGGGADADTVSGVVVEIASDTFTFCAGGYDSRTDGPGAGGKGGWTSGTQLPGTDGVLYLEYRIA